MQRISLACFLSALVGIGAGVALATYGPLRLPSEQQRSERPRLPERQTGGDVTVPLPEELTEADRTGIAVYQRCERAVVHIASRAVQVDAFFGIEIPAQGSGSGWVWDQQGHILTNYHVVEGSQELSVTMFDGQQYDAEIVGADPPNDLALLQIDAPSEKLYPLDSGDSEHLLVGQQVYAIGSPFGLERTMTAGIISSLNRRLPGHENRIMKSMIQVDAALNMGNSGGPLLDARGLVVGMNTAIAGSQGENTGVGFAIPSATIRRIVPQLIERGRVIRPDIGIAAVTAAEEGLRVVQVTPGGPADQAGIRGVQIYRRRTPFGNQRVVDVGSADVLVSVDGQPVRSVDDLLTIVESHEPGDRIPVVVRRGENRIRMSVVLEEERP